MVHSPHRHPRRNRIAFPSALAALLALLLCTPTFAVGQASDLVFEDTVRTMATSVELDSWGNLGGVTVDALGFVYVANFRDKVWRINPDGQTVLVSDALYGASGNVVDRQGRLLQANFNGHTIDRIDRSGRLETVLSDGLQGPVGLAQWTDESVFICNCAGNYISRWWPDGRHERVAEGPLFNCPNGIAQGPDNAIYITNYNGDDIIRLDPDADPGENISVFATVPSTGNAHLAYAKGAFYVTQIKTNALVRVAMDGTSTPVVVPGIGGSDDGPASTATLSRPNGIAFDAARSRLYVNVLDGKWSTPEPARVVVRTIDLGSLTGVVTPAAEAGDIDAMRAAYQAYRSSPQRAGESTLGEAIRLAYRLLSNRNASAAMALFALNAESYPDQAPALFALGEGYRYTGQTDQAIATYRRVLAVQPGHPGATSQLAALGGG